MSGSVHPYVGPSVGSPVGLFVKKNPRKIVVFDHVICCRRYTEHHDHHDHLDLAFKKYVKKNVSKPTWITCDHAAFISV